MNFELSEKEIQKIADLLAEKLIKTEKQPPRASLDDWIRADGLYSRGLFSRPTLIKYHKKGLIGKSTIGATVCYYIPDILELLRANYYKPEALDKISKELRERNNGKLQMGNSGDT